MLVLVEQAQEDALLPDISERIQFWCHEGIARKFEIHQTPGLTSDEKSLLCIEVNQDIEIRKTSAERKVERLFYFKYPCEGARDVLLQKLIQMEDKAVEGIARYEH